MYLVQAKFATNDLSMNEIFFLHSFILPSVVQWYLLSAFWEEIMWPKAISCFSFSSFSCLRLSLSPGSCDGFCCSQLIVSVLWLQLFQSLLTELVLWAKEKWEATAWGVCLQNTPNTWLVSSIKFISKYLWLAVQAVWVIVPSNVHAGSGSDLRRLFQPSIIKVFKNKLWLSAAVQGEVLVNAPFPAGSTAENHQLQLFPHIQKEVKKTMQFVSFLPLIQYQNFLHVIVSVSRKEDCFWLRGFQRVRRNYLVGEIMGQYFLITSNQPAAFLLSLLSPSLTVGSVLI